MTGIDGFSLGVLTGATGATAVAMLGARLPALRKLTPALLVALAGALTFVTAAAAMLLILPRHPRASAADPHPAALAGTAGGASLGSIPLSMLAGTAGATAVNGAPRAAPMDVAAAQLAARLKREGGSPADWNLLAESYEFLGRPKAAEWARERAAAQAATESLKFPSGAAAAPAAVTGKP